MVASMSKYIEMKRRVVRNKIVYFDMYINENGVYGRVEVDIYYSAPFFAVDFYRGLWYCIFFIL
jgi:hypothetical protein